MKLKSTMLEEVEVLGKRLWRGGGHGMDGVGTVGRVTMVAASWLDPDAGN